MANYVLKIMHFVASLTLELHVFSIPDIPETEDYRCQGSLADTCSGETRSKILIKSKTLRKLKENINDYSENCQDECVEILKTRTRVTRKRKEKRDKQCSCFCFYHQVCLPKQTTGR